MKGWLYERIAELMAPYGITPQEYCSELHSEGAGWAEIHTLMRQEFEPWKMPTEATIKRWAS